MFNPPISSGANLFIIVALAIMAAGAAIIAVDAYKELILNKIKQKKEK